MRAHDPAAAHRFRRPLEIRFPKSEARQDPLGFRFDLPVEIMMIIGGGCWQSASNSAGELQHRLVTRGGIFLWQITNRRGFLDRDRAFVRCRLAEDEREKRALARAVRSDQADTSAAVPLQRSVLEKRPTAKRLCHL